MNNKNKPIITRIENNKKTDAVRVECPHCNSDIAYLMTRPNDDKHLVEKLFKGGNKYYEKCQECDKPLDWSWVK